MRYVLVLASAMLLASAAVQGSEVPKFQSSEVPKFQGAESNRGTRNPEPRNPEPRNPEPRNLGTLEPRNPGLIAGVVRDASGLVLPGASITIRDAAGEVVATATADAAGSHQTRLRPGIYAVEIALVNFATRRHPPAPLVANQVRSLETTLALVLTADVTVTGRRSFRNLAELDSAAEGLLGIADTASEGLISNQQLELRPVMRTGEILEAIPGLVISQHSGEGKANQYYLRGFNLDHGTDFATTVGGMPVNLRTHAHGQGYSDINFLIPELVSTVQFRKGLYSAEQGDFSAAGSSNVGYLNRIERPFARLSVGGDGWRRALGVVSPRLGGGELLVAFETVHNDGPWVHPDDYDKTNAVIKFSRGDLQNGFAVTGMLYRGDWNGTDQVPVRAIESGSLPRFGSIDPTTGGETQRSSLSMDWQKSTGRRVTRVNAYALRYRLNLFSNFTYALADQVNGDQFEQADRRWIGGGRLTHRELVTVAGRPAEFVAGLDLRRDAIGDVGLYLTRARERLTTIRSDRVNESSAAVFAQYDVQWTPWLRSSAGARADRFWFDVTADNPLNTGARAAGLVSPKLSAVLGPWRRSEFYVSTGTGFHSNDARGVTSTVDPVSGAPADSVPPLTRARGAELGFRTMPVRGLQMTAAVWTLRLDSELVFVGDAGTTEAGRPSRRAGLEVSTLYSVRPWLTLDADVAWSRARFADADPAGRYIPGALARVVAAGLTVPERGRIGGSIRLRHFGPRALIEDATVRSQATTIVNGQVTVAVNARTRMVLDAFNLFDQKVSDVEYFYTSRLPGEPAEGVADVHSHPALPRSLRLGLQIGF